MSFLLALSASTQAADILQQVPRDALGFVVVRNLAQVDARAAKLLDAVQVTLPGPLTMLKATIGLGDGLDNRRDLMLVFLPPENDSRQFHLAVWLPVKDYDALIRSLNGDPMRRVAAVTVAGEDLLAVRHEDWAVLADQDQRDRLEALREAPKSVPRQIALWKPWIETNDVVLVVLPSGITTAWAWARQPDPSASAASAGAPSDDETFGPTTRRAIPLNEWAAIREWVQVAVTAMPTVAEWASKAESAACGLRLDEVGNVVAGARLAFAEGHLPAASTSGVLPPRLYNGGDFVVDGFGTTNQAWAVPAVAPYIRTTANDLAAVFGITLDEESLAEFRGLVEQAVSDVEALATLTRPGEKEEGVFTNSYLALRVKSADEFLARANTAMERWNAMLEKAEGGARLAFETKSTTIAERPGTEYSLDMAVAIGVEPIPPEARESNEKLFGPGGKFRVQYVRVDERTVLLAVATAEQVAKVIPVLEAADAADVADLAELRTVNELLGGAADWRLYFSPHAYFAWMNRQMHAIVGEVIGGPLVKEFPESPPVGAAGGVADNVVWADVAIPAETLRRAGKYARED